MKKQLVKIISLFSVLVLLCCPVQHLFATAVSATKEIIASKVDEKVLSAFDDGAQTVKVYVWLNDIDQKQVDKIVEQKTGLRADNLAVIDENISNELATRIVSEADNDKLTTETEKMLQAYLDRTAAQRTQERERTDLYTATRRAEAKAKYNEKSAAFLTANSISSEKVLFNSNYAPMLILDLTKQEINALAKREDVLSVDLYEDDLSINDLALSSNLEKIGINRTKTISGLTGKGVKIGIAEIFTFNEELGETDFSNRLTIIDGISSDQTDSTDAHGYKVASIAAGDDGIANESEIYLIGISSVAPDELGRGNVANYYTYIENLISMGVNVINISLAITYESANNEPFYNNRCKWTDHIAAQHGVTIVKSAGNNGLSSTYISCPGLAENIITVGGYIYYSDVDDNLYKELYANSSFEELNGVSKPDVVGLALWSSSVGTSFAAPIISGIVCLLLELRPSLAVFPHVLKSIIMASCHEKALPAINGETPETMTAGLTEKQGAGIVNPYIAVSIAAHGTYGFGVLENDITTERIKFLQPITDADAINVTVTWLRESFADETNHANGSSTANGNHDIDFHVMSNGSILSMSTKSNTSAEMIYAYFDEEDNEDFEIVVRRCTVSEQDIRYAYAWSVDCMRFQYNYPFEGIGYLKNLNSSYYMEADTTALTVLQQTFDGDANQMWILRRNANASTYQLQSAYASIGAFTDASAISAAGASAVTVLLNDDGTYSFIRTNGTTQYILGVANNSATSGASIAWQMKGDSVTDSQKWCFEVCAYEKGDHDLSGHINSSDSRYVSRAAVDLETPNIIQAFLCDVDSDGDITSADARLVSRYAVGLDP